MPAARGWTRGRRPDQSRCAAMRMHTPAVPGDRLVGDDRPERLVPLRMPAVASAATGLPRRCGNSIPTDSSTRPHRPAAPIGGTAWFSERLPIRVWGSETLSCRLTCNVMAAPVTVGHRHSGSTGTCGPGGPTAGAADLRVRPRYTAGIRQVHLALSCRVTDRGEITDRVHR